ncbi:MAG TPA: 2'-5' RNA ligase family protein [Novosphingobium sp.]|nr:2'-5' RNA ligase family protein [Novosphingobium sp.]HQQ08656.1 2'-5' RNA ligase family protein [Novosphingobium sp.]
MDSDTPSSPSAPSFPGEPLLDSAAPFIVTAELPADVLAWSDALRRVHFPPERNWLKAHVTLFHAFAPSLREELLGVLGRFAAEFAPPAARIEGLMDLGGGTALAIRSPGMLAIRAAIADHFHGALTAQDQGTPRLHITIQNKVQRASAKALQAELGPQLSQRDFVFPGLGLHIYRRPHWEELRTWRLRGKEGG